MVSDGCEPPERGLLTPSRLSSDSLAESGTCLVDLKLTTENVAGRQRLACSGLVQGMSWGMLK